MGANIKIGSDTKKFQDDMKKLTQDLKLMESGLVTTSLKAELFGSAEDKAGAKANELAQKLKGQTAILDLQKQSIVALTNDIQKYRDRNEILKTSIAETEKKIKDSIKATGDNSKETNKLTQELAKLQTEYSKNDKEIVKTTKSQSDLTLKVGETEREMLKSQKIIQDNAKETNKLSEENTKLNKTMEDVKVAFGAIGFASLNYLKNAVVGVANAEPSIAVLTRALKNQGMSTEEATKGMSQFSKAVTDMSTFTGGEARSALEVLTRKGVELSVSLENVTAITDTAKGMNISLAESADMVASAYNGKTRALMALGILSKEEIKSMADQEDSGLRLNEIQKRLEERFGGSAQVEMNTFNGILKEITNAFNTLKASIGKTMIEELKGFANGLKEAIIPVIDFLKEHAKVVALTMAIGGLLAVVFGGLAVILKLGGLVTAIIPLFAPVLSFFTAITAPMVAVVVGLGLLVVAIVHLWKTSEEFRDNIKELGSALGRAFTTIIDILKGFWDKFGWILINIFKEVVAVIGFIINILSKLSPTLVETIGLAIGMAVVITPIILLVLKISTAVSAFTGFLGIFGMTGQKTTLIILGVVAALVALAIAIAVIMGKSKDLDNSFKTISNTTSKIGSRSKLGKYSDDMPSFAVGTNYVPQDMVAQIHKGEAIIPAKYNNANSKFNSGSNFENKQSNGDTYIFKVDMGEIDDVIKLKNVLNKAKQNKRQFA